MFFWTRFAAEGPFIDCCAAERTTVYFPFLSVQFSSTWYLSTGKSAHAVRTASLENFFNVSIVGVINDSPYSRFKVDCWPLSHSPRSLSFPQVIVCVESLALCLLVESQNPQHQNYFLSSLFLSSSWGVHSYPWSRAGQQLVSFSEVSKHYKVVVAGLSMPVLALPVAMNAALRDSCF